MSTPVKNLLSPKLFSSVLPVLNVSPIKNSTSLSPVTNFRALSSAKALDFGNSAIKHSPLRHNCTEVSKNIKIKITDYSHGSLLINTPNKKYLTTNGIRSEDNLKILGRGSFGTVVRGIYKDAPVAVKIVKLKIHSDSVFDFKERNALGLVHKNVIQVIDIIFKRDANYGIVVMEYLEKSRHLQSILDEKQTNINREALVRYALDICEGLQYCHENGVLHLDIKPSNVLVCQDLLCKICDFGNSMRICQEDYFYNHQGTAAYTAPEIFMGKRPTTKSDIYSLGILFWQMKYREMPYSELDTIEVIIYKVVKFEYRPKLPVNFTQDGYTSIFMDCWATNPLNRPDMSSIISKLCSLRSS